MRKIFFIIFIAIGSVAQAADFSFVPASTPGQKEFKSHLEEGRPEKALKLWSEAFDGSAFAASMNGRALYAYTLVQSGLPMVGMKILTRETQGSQLSPKLHELWKPIIDTYINEIPGLEMNASWKRIFSSRNVSITKASQVPELMKRTAKMSNQDPEKTRLLWKIITTAPQWNDMANALKAIAMLKSYKQALIGDDQLELAHGRILFQKGQIDQALEHYQAIPKSSEFWLEALEERAWSHLRKNDHDKAVSDITTLLASPFAAVTGPEPYFLSELTSLKICDYPKVLKTSQSFKNRHKDRLAELSTLASTGSNKGLVPMMEGIDSKGLTFQGIGPNIQWMPRGFMRDLEFSSNMKYRLNLLTELKRSKDLSKDEKIERLLADNLSQADRARSKAVARLKKLASQDLEEYRININKLHIVEAEVIQRLVVDERLKGKRKDIEVAKEDSNTLTFPYSDREVWMDELDHYKSSVKDCPALPSTKGASL